jgi:hypothetical protein
MNNNYSIFMSKNTKMKELDVDFIGDQSYLTAQEEDDLREYLKSRKSLNSKTIPQTEKRERIDEASVKGTSNNSMLAIAAVSALIWKFVFLL